MSDRYARERGVAYRGRLAAKVAAGVFGAAVAQVMLAPAVWAVTASLSSNEGPPGTQVTVLISDLAIPCEVRFDDLLVVGEEQCQPSADGSVSPSFAVPAEATVGNHQVRVSASRPGSSSQLSNSFRVTASRPRSSSTGSSRSTPPATPGPNPSPTPSRTPPATPSPTPSTNPTPTGLATAESPSAPLSGAATPAGAASEAGSDNSSAGILALIALGAGLSVAAVVYALIQHKGRVG